MVSGLGAHDSAGGPGGHTERRSVVRDALRRGARATAAFGEAPDDDEATRLRKSLLVTVAFMVLPASIIWGLLYWAAGQQVAALLPLCYMLASIASLVVFRITRDFRLLRDVQLGIVLVVPFVAAVALGGLAPSGMVIIWGFLAPLGAIAFGSARIAWRWFAAFIITLVAVTPLSAILRPDAAAMSPGLVVAFLVLNAVVVAFISFVLLVTFARQREEAQRQADALLLNILPAEIAERLKADPRQIADQFDDASVLFADVVEFTPLSARLSASEVVSLLDRLFSGFDALADRYGVEKIKTVGDAYMVAAGVPASRPDHAQALAAMALDMRDLVEADDFLDGLHLRLRIGIDSGPVVAGVIGHRKFIYDLWGDTVNMASRMESQGTAGQIQIGRATYDRINGQFLCRPRGTIELKGKGAVDTWYLVARKSA